MKQPGQTRLTSGGTRFGLERGKAIKRFGVFGVNFEDATIQWNRAPRKPHRFVEFTKLEVGGRVPLIELYREIEMMDRILPILRKCGQAACQHRVMFSDVRSDLHALAQP